jgi:hypothetical protein
MVVKGVESPERVLDETAASEYLAKSFDTEQLLAVLPLRRFLLAPKSS